MISHCEIITKMWCLTQLWPGSNVIASHPAGPGSIPGQVSFPGWGLYRCFLSTIRQMSGKLRPHTSRISLGILIIKNNFITDGNDLWWFRAQAFCIQSSWVRDTVTQVEHLKFHLFHQNGQHFQLRISIVPYYLNIHHVHIS